MKTDRAFLKKAFEEYVSAFDASDERISLKILHTAKVAENSDIISSGLGLTDHQRDLAWTIAMLHDIGRFEQAARTHSFLDSASGDHADAGVRYLFDEGYIRLFFPEDTSSEEDLHDLACIRSAILYHNKFQVPENLSAEKSLFCHIIRDADKADIFRICLENSFEAVHEYSRDTIAVSPVSPAVKECFEKHETLDYSLRKYPADIFLGHIAMCFGLHYSCARRLAAEQGYMERIMDFTFADGTTQQEFEEMKREVRKFLSGV